MDATRFMEEETFIAWATTPEAPSIAVTKPFDGNAATVGNGVMVPISAASTDQVKALHAQRLLYGELAL